MHAHIWRKNQNKCIKETIKILIASYLINSLPQIIKKSFKKQLICLRKLTILIQNELLKHPVV